MAAVIFVRKPGSSGSMYRALREDPILSGGDDADGDDGEDEESLHLDDVVVEQAGGRDLMQRAVCILIILNTAVIALEAVFIGSTWLKVFFNYVELMFTVCYVFDIAVRIRTVGWRVFMIGDDWAWNHFDLAVTSAGVGDAVLNEWCGVDGGSGASVARLFRVLRILRLFRAGRFLRDMDYVCITASIATLKLVVVVFMVVFVFAIIATNLLWDSKDPQTAGLFLDLGQSMWTLFKVMTLDGWVQTLQPAMENNLPVKFFFITFIFIGAISLMSLVPALFVQLKLDTDKRQEQEVRENEWKKLLEKEHAMLGVIWNFLGVDIAEAGTINVAHAAARLSDPAILKEVDHAGAQLSTSRHHNHLAGWKPHELHDLVQDVQLALFTPHEERGGKDARLDRNGLSELLTCRHSTDPRLLWRFISEARHELQLIGGKLMSELQKFEAAHKEAALAEQQAQTSADVQRASMRNDLAVAAAERASLQKEVTSALHALVTAQSSAWQIALDAKSADAAAATARAEELARALCVARREFDTEMHHTTAAPSVAETRTTDGAKITTLCRSTSASHRAQSSPPMASQEDRPWAQVSCKRAAEAECDEVQVRPFQPSGFARAMSLPILSGHRTFEERGISQGPAIV